MSSWHHPGDCHKVNDQLQTDKVTSFMQKIKPNIRKLIPTIISIIFMAITFSGCVGLVVNIPAECNNETPFTNIHDIDWSKSSLMNQNVSTKEEFLKDWGKPDQIVTISENEETWIYKRHLWCGAVPFFVLPVPLLLPVCDGFDRIEFEGNEAKRLRTRHIVLRGVVFPFVGSAFEGSPQTYPACRLPLPLNDGSDSGALGPTAHDAP